MEAMKACGNKKCCTVDGVCQGERGFVVFQGLKTSEVQAKGDSYYEAVEGLYMVGGDNRMVSPSNRDPRGQ